MQFFDCHCHTERSACAEDVSLEMYVEIAGKSDVVFAITDHSAHLFYPPDQSWAFWADGAESVFEEHYSRGLEQCADYIEWIRGSQTGNMLLGVELDALPDGRVVFDERLLPELDVLLGAVHGIRGLTKNLPTHEVVAEYKARTLRLCELGIQALVHPFREWKQKEREVPTSLLEWLVQTAFEQGISLELNCHYEVPEYDVPMVRMCIEAGVPIAIGTDTHRSYEFGDFSYHERILSQVGAQEDQWPDLTMSPPVVNREARTL